MGKIYTEDGWINWDYITDQKIPFVSVVGPRGTGKTYGLMKWMIENKLKFLYLRRLKSQLDQCGKPEGNPFKKLNTDFGYNINPYNSSGTVSFRYGDKDGELAAVGVALSVVANLRGVDYSDFQYIIFDEFIASDGERPIKNEFYAFLNFYETVNRNRELAGADPVFCYMLGNANKLNNPYFTGWHFMRTAVKMIRGKQMVWRSPENTRMVIMLLDSPISQRKADTALYKNATDDFLTMALDNAFKTDETKIKSEPLKEFIHIVSIGEIGIYRHKTERRYYVSSTISQDLYYEPFGITLKMFQQDFYLLRVSYMTRKNFTFENFENEILFRSYFEMI